MPYSEVLRARLLALLDRHGDTARSLARKAGVAHTTFGRKLNPDHAQARPLTVSDVDLILETLGEPAWVLDGPVLCPGDSELLAWVAEREGEEWAYVSDAARIFSDVEERIRRLSAQRVLAIVEDGPAEPSLQVHNAAHRAALAAFARKE